jgi:hypothetical protein
MTFHDLLNATLHNNCKGVVQSENFYELIMTALQIFTTEWKKCFKEKQPLYKLTFKKFIYFQIDGPSCK